MPVTTPPTITALPAAPDPANRATFNTLAYPWSAALGTWTTQVQAVASNVAANATDAATSATAASGSATTAGGHATNAGTSATLAQNWATQTGTPVSGGEYSAKYYALQAAAVVATIPTGTINDGTTSSTGVWSSSKVSTELAGKAATADITAERSATANLTNKTLALGSNTVSGTLSQFNTAVTDADLASLAGTETLTNKTLTTPVLSGTASGTTAGMVGYASGVLTYGDGTSQNEIGFRNIPQNSQSAAYTCVLADSGKHILHPSADTTARIFTIPANASVAFPVGTAITFVNQASAGTVTIAITTDTMRLAGAGTTGSRTLAANGVATAIKLTSTEWIISGTGLT